MKHDIFKIIVTMKDGKLKYEKCDYIGALRYAFKSFDAEKLFGGVKSAKIFNMSRGNELFLSLA